ncbi:MAG: hypothetical protein JSU06_05835 [Actinobacteria bacterium]|nr:hypothetical protein [Actinomycetota bacterium]
MQGLSRCWSIARSELRRRGATSLAVGALLLALALALAARPAAAAPAPATKPCPNFRVLHNDRIGAAVIPAGNYLITLEGAGLTCKSAGELFAEFLAIFDGRLPAPWKVAAEGSGKASFRRGSAPGFSIELNGKREEGGKNPDLGTLCPNPFTLNADTVIKPLRFTKGKFLIYLPPGSGITCNRAAVLFTRFLGAGGTLPPPWKLISQTATFYKPSNPTRSAFRIEPFSASGGS